jgi:hypothetical protein
MLLLGLTCGDDMPAKPASEVGGVVGGIIGSSVAGELEPAESSVNSTGSCCTPEAEVLERYVDNLELEPRSAAERLE